MNDLLLRQTIERRGASFGIDTFNRLRITDLVSRTRAAGVAVVESVRWYTPLSAARGLVTSHPWGVRTASQPDTVPDGLASRPPNVKGHLRACPRTLRVVDQGLGVIVWLFSCGRGSWHCKACARQLVAASDDILVAYRPDATRDLLGSRRRGKSCDCC